MKREAQKELERAEIEALEEFIENNQYLRDVLGEDDHD